MISEKREIVISNFCFKTKFPEIRKFLNSFNPIPKKFECSEIMALSMELFLFDI